MSCIFTTHIILLTRPINRSLPNQNKELERLILRKAELTAISLFRNIFQKNEKCTNRRHAYDSTNRAKDAKWNSQKTAALSQGCS